MITEISMELILASGSPRRKKLLADMGFDFEVKIPDVVESDISGESPGDHVLRLSALKADSVARRFPGDMVLGADTIVVLDNRIIGKPDSPEHALEMLKDLSGKTHTVYTGLTIVMKERDFKLSEYDRSDVTFNILCESDIREYIESGEPLDKAGSYGIQGIGSFLVKEYRGELDTVIGFPSKLFSKMYQEAGSCLKL